MKCCVSTDFGTWTNWLTFALDPDHSPDAGTRLLSPVHRRFFYDDALYKSTLSIYPISYRLWNLPRLPVSCAALRNFMSGKIPRKRIGSAPLRASRGFKWFYLLSRRKTFVKGKCALPVFGKKIHGKNYPGKNHPGKNHPGKNHPKETEKITR